MDECCIVVVRWKHKESLTTVYSTGRDLCSPVPLGAFQKLHSSVQENRNTESLLHMAD